MLSFPPLQELNNSLFHNIWFIITFIYSQKLLDLIDNGRFHVNRLWLQGFAGMGNFCPASFCFSIRPHICVRLVSVYAKITLTECAVIYGTFFLAHFPVFRYSILRSNKKWGRTTSLERPFFLIAQPMGAVYISEAAFSAVAGHTHGNPRLIDNLMTDALAIGKHQGKKCIDTDVILAAVNNQNLG